MWPFSRRKEPEAPPPAKPEPLDLRNWNEDWKVGDTAECVVSPDSRRWLEECRPWERPALGQQFTVSGFSENKIKSINAVAYFLELEGWPVRLSTTAFRKVRPVATEQSEIVQRILNAKPGADRKREDATTPQPITDTVAQSGDA